MRWVVLAPDETRGYERKESEIRGRFFVAAFAVLQLSGLKISVAKI